jgi:hypothetical protein
LLGAHRANIDAQLSAQRVKASVPNLKARSPGAFRLSATIVCHQFRLLSVRDIIRRGADSEQPVQTGM